MARKDDPVFNVKFVQLVESQPCLWNYTNPGYSKKEEVQKAWQHVANEIKDTVRNCRERWRTIRSSFLRSLKLARTQTGRGKRKYYLSKYLQFLIPYTKARSCHKPVGQLLAGGSPNGMVLRKPSTSQAAATFLAAAALGNQPMTRISHMRLLEHHHNDDDGHNDDDDTKDSNASDNNNADAAMSSAAGLPLDIQVSMHEDAAASQAPPPPLPPTSCLPLRLHTIKIEQQQHQHQSHNGNDKMAAAHHQQSLVTLPVTMAAALRNNMNWPEFAEWLKNNNNNNNNNNNSMVALASSHVHNSNGGASAATPPPTVCTPAPTLTLPTPPPPPLMAATHAQAQPPDADYSFLISLHPYLKEMSGKQNRRFRQKVVGLIDNVLDNVDV